MLTEIQSTLFNIMNHIRIKVCVRMNIGLIAEGPIWKVFRNTEILIVIVRRMCGQRIGHRIKGACVLLIIICMKFIMKAKSADGIKELPRV